MNDKKKIALLNMRYDNNYGGNLQRFALYTVLQRMGYEVEYLYIRENWDDWYKSRSTLKILKQLIKQFLRFILHPLTEPILAWHKENSMYVEQCKVTEPFLNKYIKHTKIIYNSTDLKKTIKRGNYDAIIAGSDQIWRKKYIQRYGIGTFFLDFLSKSFKGKKIVYGASFGVNNQEYTIEDIAFIQPYFSQLDLVSVRETSALDLLNNYGLVNPKAEVVLDPTLLLTKEDYIQLVTATHTNSSSGNLFCYVLDRTDEIQYIIDSIASTKDLTPFEWSLSGKGTVEQWLRSFMDAEFVITDSYHGMLFSIIFNKPFKIIINESRGSARFRSIFQILNISENSDNIYMVEFNDQFNKLKKQSLKFLES